MKKTLFLPALFLVFVPVYAGANCARDVADVAPRIREIKDAHMRQRAENYLQRARRELAENDEFECQSAVGGIQKLMPETPAKQ